MNVKSQKQRCWKWDETLWTLKSRKMLTTIRVKKRYEHLKKKLSFFLKKMTPRSIRQRWPHPHETITSFGWGHLNVGVISFKAYKYM